MSKWDGRQLANSAAKNKATVEEYDEIEFSAFGLPPPDTGMPWINRPTYQQVVEVRSGR